MLFNYTFPLVYDPTLSQALFSSPFYHFHHSKCKLPERVVLVNMKYSTKVIMALPFFHACSRSEIHLFSFVNAIKSTNAKLK